MGITCCYDRTATSSQQIRNSVAPVDSQILRPPHDRRAADSTWVGSSHAGAVSKVVPLVRAAASAAVAERRDEGPDAGRGIGDPPSIAAIPAVRSVSLKPVDSETVQHKLVRDIMYPDVNCIKILHQISKKNPSSSQNVQTQPRIIAKESEYIKSLSNRMLKIPSNSPSKQSQNSEINPQKEELQFSSPKEGVFTVKIPTEGVPDQNEKSLSDIEFTLPQKYSSASNFSKIDPQMPSFLPKGSQIKHVYQLTKFCSEQKIVLRNEAKFEKDAAQNTRQFLASSIHTKLVRSKVTSTGSIHTSKMIDPNFEARKDDITLKNEFQRVREHSAKDHTRKLIISKESSNMQRSKRLKKPKRLVLRLNSLDPEKVSLHDEEQVSESALCSFDTSRGQVESPSDLSFSPSKYGNDNNKALKSRFALDSQRSPPKKVAPAASLRCKGSGVDFSFGQNLQRIDRFKVRGSVAPGSFDEGISFVTIGEEEEVDLLELTLTQKHLGN